MPVRRLLQVLRLGWLCLMLAACGRQPGPADAVLSYLQAVVNNDPLSAANESCAAWEETARSEGAAYANVQVTMNEVACEASEAQGENATVTCTGSLLFSYAGGETQELDLSKRAFLAVLEDGEWRMCGYR